MTSPDIDEDRKEFSGNELDELQEEGLAPAEKQPDIRTAKGLWKRAKGLWLIIGIILFSSLGIGYSYLKWQNADVIVQNKTECRQVHRFPIVKEHLLTLESFVIPLKKNKKFTYMSLSISFNAVDKNAEKEIEGKKAQLRGIIYENLQREADRSNGAPSLESLKDVIASGANMAIGTGKIRGVYITDFLCV